MRNTDICQYQSFMLSSVLLPLLMWIRDSAEGGGAALSQPVAKFTGISQKTVIKSERTREKHNHHRNRWTAQGELLSKQQERVEVESRGAFWSICMLTICLRWLHPPVQGLCFWTHSSSLWVGHQHWSCSALWWRLRNINKIAQVHIIFVEKGSCHWKCESDDLQILRFRCCLSWLTHIAENRCWSVVLFPAGRSLLN